MKQGHTLRALRGSRSRAPFEIEHLCRSRFGWLLPGLVGGMLDAGTFRFHGINLTSDEIPNLAWSADGTSLLAGGEGKLLTIPLDGSTATEIPFLARVASRERRDPRVRPGAPSPRGPFSPRGVTSLTYLPSNGKLAALCVAGDLYVVFARSLKGPMFAGSPGWEDRAFWSPDGKEIAFQPWGR